jgi:hypothetical protein
MALGSKELPLLVKLLEERRIRPGGAVMEIGAQEISGSFLEQRDLLPVIARLHGVGAPCPLPEVAGEGHPAPARLFWSWLGYRYACIDLDGTPGALPLDLNHAAVPVRHRRRYQLVTNFGTTEHVANQLNAFKVIHDLTATGGVMLHNLPAQGMFNHGLVNYNPKFFWLLARSNRYRLLHFSFNTGADGYALPANILDAMTPFDADGVKRLESYRGTDCGLVVALEKTSRAPFVAPLDVPVQREESVLARLQARLKSLMP